MNANRMVVGGVASILAACGAASGQQYTLYIQEALSTFGTPEAYFFDVNNAGAATGFMTYTEQLPSGSFSTSYKGFRWTPTGGPEVFVDYSNINGINNLGDMVVGATVLWNDGSFSSVPAVPGYPSVRAADINDNGMFVGSSHWKSTSSSSFDRAIYWTQATGTVDLTSVIPAADVANDVNNAGEIVGYVSFTSGFQDKRAFYYDTNTGEVVDLATMLHGPSIGSSNATGISELGVVVGEGTHSTNQYSGWTWSKSAGFTFMPGLGAGAADMNHPTGIDSDGSVVGYAFNGAAWRAYKWDANSGMVDLNTLVTAPNNFILDRALAISDSGVIVGDGHFGPGFGLGVGWVLVPESSGCYADCDASGSLDFFDFLCFQNEFASGTAYADCDASGSLDFFDFLCFQNQFALGCP